MADGTQDEPISWQLAQFLAERVKLIKVAGGFRTDIGLGVVVVEDEDMPEAFDGAFTVIEVERITPSQRPNASIEATVETAVPRFRGEKQPKRLIHRARHDLIRALSFNARVLPLGVTSFEIVDSLLATADDEGGNSHVIVQVTVRAGLTESFQPVS